MVDTEVRDALIVAGGQGTRLRPLTYGTPKPLLDFAGQPFALGVIRRLAAAGIERVHLVVGADTAPFETLTSQAAEHGVELHFVPEPEPLDTAGGVREVARELTGPFLCCNGDILTDIDFAAVCRRHVEAGADATIALERVDDVSSYGVCIVEDGRITDFVEKPEDLDAVDGNDTINAGTYVLEPSVFADYDSGPLSFERAVFPELAERGGHIAAYVHEGVWADLGTPDRFREGHRLALGGQMAWPSVAELPDRGDGVRVAERADVAADATLVGPVLVRPGAVVRGGATVGPHTVLGEGAEVDEGATVVRSVLFDHAYVGAGVTADGLLAGVGARVETGATLGAECVLGNGQPVGPGDVLPDRTRLPDPGSRDPDV